MIVDVETLQVRPISDRVFFDVSGKYDTDYTNGPVEWSNELSLHVIEIKSTEPVADIEPLKKQFAANIKEINSSLASHNAMLMPTAMHPFMDPATETLIWPHEYSDIYNLYNEVFNCRTHGWGNLQSMHLNLPFRNDEEFEKLHAAIRVLLPVIPAITASSPLIEGNYSGFKDTRLREYLVHQSKLPILGGSLIPERIYDEYEYSTKILIPIADAFRPLDKKAIMDPFFLNSRGAIARFDRGAIEIRVIDMQECPASDISIASVIIETLKMLIAGDWSDTAYQKIWYESHLLEIFKNIIANGENAVISDPDYLQVFDINLNQIYAGELWKILFDRIKTQLTKNAAENISFILNHGSLSSRIQSRLGKNINMKSILDTYRDLADCLKSNRMFI